MRLTGGRVKILVMEMDQSVVGGFVSLLFSLYVSWFCFCCCCFFGGEVCCLQVRKTARTLVKFENKFVCV